MSFSPSAGCSGGFEATAYAYLIAQRRENASLAEKETGGESDLNRDVEEVLIRDQGLGSADRRIEHGLARAEARIRQEVVAA
jgi:hypothetical protein